MSQTSNRFFKINELQHFSDDAAKKPYFMKRDIQLVRFGVLNQDNHYLVTHIKMQMMFGLYYKAKEHFSQMIMNKNPLKPEIYSFHSQEKRTA